MDTGFVGASPAAGSQPDYIVIVDSASTVAGSPGSLVPNLADPNNGFVLVVTDATALSGYQGISMSVFKSGTKYDYACTTPVSTFIDCGSSAISLNIANKTVTFTNLLVTNTNSSDNLTMNGTLSWQ